MGSFIIQTCCLTTALMLSEEAFKRERERAGSITAIGHGKRFVYRRKKINMEKPKRSALSSSFYRFCPQVVMKTSLQLLHLLLLPVYITAQ